MSTLRTDITTVLMVYPPLYIFVGAILFLLGVPFSALCPFLGVGLGFTIGRICLVIRKDRRNKKVATP